MTRSLYFAALILASAAAFAADQDHDGIPDDWETHGVTVTLPNGHTRFLNLPQEQASPNRRDIIVWINWMEAPGDHSHKPVPNTSKAPGGSGPIEKAALDRIKRSFLARGINLILFYGEAGLPETPFIGGTDSNAEYIWNDLDTLTRTQFPVSPANFGNVVHLCTFIHQMGGSAAGYSGMAQTIPGRQFLVSLGGSDNQVGDADSQGGTFMHELGHDLGLRHGGPDNVHRKPNYLSVMNYLFQVTGIQIGGVFGNFDYSDHSFPFNELAVDPRRGVTSDTSLAAYGSAEVCNASTGRYRYFASVNTPLRWDCTANAPSPGPPVPKDVNKDGETKTLLGWHDWNSIRLDPFSPDAGAPQIITPRTTDELPLEHITQMLRGLIPPAVSISRRPDGLLLTWKRLPLDSVVAYELLRTRPGGRTDIIRQTKTTEYLDTSAQPGVDYVYQVRTVFNGLSSQAIDDAATSIKGAVKLMTDSLREVISPNQRLNTFLVRGNPSAPARAAK